MGMAHEFFFTAELSKDTPETVIEALKWFIGISDQKPILTYGDPAEFWRGWLDNQSFEFPENRISQIIFVSESLTYHIVLKTVVGTYSDHVEKFLYWIAPYIDTVDEQFVGYLRSYYGINLYYMDRERRPVKVVLTEEVRYILSPERWS